MYIETIWEQHQIIIECTRYNREERKLNTFVIGVGGGGGGGGSSGGDDWCSLCFYGESTHSYSL